MTPPRLVIIGQITVDDVVPAEPGPWRRQTGGNALYAAAGARLILPAHQIGIVSRLGAGMNAAIEGELQERGFRTALARRPEPHLVEWLLYEADGGRRALPKGDRFRSIQDSQTERETYLAALEAISPSPDDVPDDWREATAFHLAPQIWKRHAAHLEAIPLEALATLDPSPHYAKHWDLDMFARTARNALTFLPSEQELAGLIGSAVVGSDLISVATTLVERLGRHAVVKLGAEGALFWHEGVRHAAAAAASEKDPTGAGDGFCGAFAAANALGWPHDASVEAASVAGAMMVECRGVAEAHDLSRGEFEHRLTRYRETADAQGDGRLQGETDHA